MTRRANMNGSWLPMTGVSATGTHTGQLNQLQGVPEILTLTCHGSSLRTTVGPTGRRERLMSLNALHTVRRSFKLPGKLIGAALLGL